MVKLRRFTLLSICLTPRLWWTLGDWVIFSSFSESLSHIRVVYVDLGTCRQRHQHQHPTRRLDTGTGESSTRMPSRSTLWDRDIPSTSRDPDRERHLVHEDVTPFFNIPATIGPSLSRKNPSSGGLRRLGDEQVNYPSGIHRRFSAEKNENRRRDGHSSALLWSLELTTSSKVTTAATSLPFDVLLRIAGSFSWHDLWSATLTCKTWCKGLEPLREGMLFLQWGKKFKHGHGFAKNLDKALQSFTKGAVRGCAAAMVDAGLLLWEMVGSLSCSFILCCVLLLVFFSTLLQML